MNDNPKNKIPLPDFFFEKVPGGSSKTQENRGRIFQENGVPVPPIGNRPVPPINFPVPPIDPPINFPIPPIDPPINFPVPPIGNIPVAPIVPPVLTPEAETEFYTLVNNLYCYFQRLNRSYKIEQANGSDIADTVLRLRNHAYVLFSQSRNILDCSKCREIDWEETEPIPTRRNGRGGASLNFLAYQCGDSARKNILNLMYLIDDFYVDIRLAMLFLRLNSDLEILDKIVKSGR